LIELRLANAPHHDGERLHLHAKPTSKKEVAEFVDRDQDRENHHKGDSGLEITKEERN
jgi:hypothetical protein